MNTEILMLVVIPLIAFAISYGLIKPAHRLGEYLGIIDKPRQGELQETPKARTGGYAMFAAFFLASMLSLLLFPRFPDEYPRLLGLLLGALLILPIAFLDDLLRLGPLPQIVGQMVVAAVPILLGVRVDSIANPFGGEAPLPEFLIFPVTLLWFLGMMNTVNFIDTMDGVAGGIAAIAGAVLAVRAIQLEQYSIAILMLALTAACCGFLPFNLYPSRIIMGTSGSMFLGYALAALAILGGAKIATTTMVLAVPIIDTAIVILGRALDRRSPFQGGDSAHLPHRLVAAGLSQRKVAFLIYGLCATLGALSLALSALQKLYTFIGVALLLAAVVIALHQMGLLSISRLGARVSRSGRTNRGRNAKPRQPEQI